MKRHRVGGSGLRTRAVAMARRYRITGATYSNEAFDLTQHIASLLSQADREAGNSVVGAGYSDKNWKLAERLVRGKFKRRA